MQQETLCERCAAVLTTFDEETRCVCEACFAKECQHMEDDTREAYNELLVTYRKDVDKINTVRKMFGLPCL